MDMPEWWKSRRLSAQYDIDHPVASRPSKSFCEERIKIFDLMKEMAEVLEYYAHKDHYEPNNGLSMSNPGVLFEGGDMARAVLNKFKEWK